MDGFDPVTGAEGKPNPRTCKDSARVTMPQQIIKANKPKSLLKAGTTFTDQYGTEWTIVVSAGDGTAAVESEDDAAVYDNGMLYVSEEEDTYGPNNSPDYIVRNGSWYNNIVPAKDKPDFVLNKRGGFRPARKKTSEDG